MIITIIAAAVCLVVGVINAFFRDCGDWKHTEIIAAIYLVGSTILAAMYELARR